MPLLISDYFTQMAERVYGDAAATERSRGAATLARWIFRKRPKELHVRRLQREEQLPSLRSAEQIRDAAEVLVEATCTMSVFVLLVFCLIGHPGRMPGTGRRRNDKLYRGRRVCHVRKTVAA
jgi:hypothetical protein